MGMTGEGRRILFTRAFNLEFNADYSEVLRYLGCPGGYVKDGARIGQMVLDTYQEVKRFAVPRGIYGTFRIERLPDGGFLLPEAGLSLLSRDLEALWQDSEKMTILAATLGNSVDQLVSYLVGSGQYAKAVIADAIGSAAAEAAIEQVDSIVRKEARQRGKTLTARFSPGYGDVSLDLQKDLVALVGADEIGIEVTEAFILKPRKSVTALLAWSDSTSHSAKSEEADCQFCKFKECRFRRSESRDAK